MVVAATNLVILGEEGSVGFAEKGWVMSFGT